MTMDVVRKGILYTKEIQDVTFFGSMSHPRLLASFLASPLYHASLPLIGLWLSLLAVLDAYKLAKAANKNFDLWFQLLISVSCAVLSNISIAGLVIATSMGTVFAAGSWLFLSSVLLGTAHQLVMCGVNAFRAWSAPKNSTVRSEFLQSALMHLYLSGLMTGITGTVIFIMLTPVAPIVGHVFALITTTMVIGNILWRLVPEHWRLAVKSKLHLEPQRDNPVEGIKTLSFEKSPVFHEQSTHCSSLFSQKDYHAEVVNMDSERALVYFLELIDTKIQTLITRELPLSSKLEDKISLLQQIKQQLQQGERFDKDKLLEQYPLAFQSFWLQKGDVESIVDAILKHQLSEQRCGDQILLGQCP